MIVSSLNDLIQAINSKEAEIQIDTSFNINQRININYTVNISGTSENITVTRNAGFLGSFFVLVSGSNVSFSDLIFDGDKENNKASSTNQIEPLINVSAGSIEFNNVKLVDNWAHYYGGAVNLYGNTVCKLINSTISGCQSNVSGGAINMNAAATLTCDKSNFTLNQSYSGGAIYNTNGTVNLTDCLIQGNVATMQNGGGIYSTLANANLTITDSNIQNNNAQISGGGIYFYNGGSCIIDNCQISENTAGTNGGGVGAEFVSNSMNLKVSNSGFDQNSAINGGGVYCLGSGSNLSVSGCNFTKNSATLGAGIQLTRAGSVSITGSHFEDNTAVSAGGGLSIQQTSVDSIANNTLVNNTSQLGGGIYANGVNAVISVRLTDNTIMNNSATNYGGGIILNYVEADLAGDKISENSASYGGGLFLYASAIITLGTGTSLENNSAQYGKDIYVGGTLNVTGVVASTSGVYIPSASNVIKITGSVENSRIQLEQSDYVSPESEDTITVAIATQQYPVLTEDDRKAFIKPVTEFENWAVIKNSENDEIQLVYSPQVYSITYLNLLQATHTNPTEYTFESETIVLLSPSEIEGYTFTGWYDALEGGNIVTEIPQGSEGDIVLYARWTEQPQPQKYCVRFCSCLPCKVCNMPRKICGEQGTTVIIPRNTPVTQCFCFVGWNTDKCGRGKKYLPGVEITLDKNINLYAMWRRV